MNKFVVKGGHLWQRKGRKWIDRGSVGPSSFAVSIDNNLAEFGGRFYSSGRTIRYEVNGQLVKEDYIPNRGEEEEYEGIFDKEGIKQ